MDAVSWAWADDADLAAQLSRAEERRSALSLLAPQVEAVADRLRGWLGRIPDEVDDWYSLSSRAYSESAGRLLSQVEDLARAGFAALEELRAEASRLEAQCAEIRRQIGLRSALAVAGIP